MADAQDGPSLADPYARLNRAREHINCLHERTQRFVEGEGYSVAIEPEAEGGWEAVYFQVHQEPPPELATILSDALHNWRAALDNLAWQLVLLNGEEPGDHTGFPIFPNRSDFEGRRGQRRLEGMSDTHKSAIADMQPYPGRDSPRIRALEIVHALAKTDRHKTLQATLVARPQVETPFRFIKVGEGPTPTVDIRISAKGARLERGTKLASLRVRTDPAYPDMKVRVEPLIEVVFGKRALRLYALPRIGIEIGEVVRVFAPDFPD